MKEVEFFDTDFLGAKIEIGDKVIFEIPRYRDFSVGTVITKTSKSCQIEYMNTWNYSGKGRKETVRQYYGQIIKYPLIKEGKWLNEDFPEKEATQVDIAVCSVCKGYAYKAEHGYSILSKFCPHCGAKMRGE